MSKRNIMNRNTEFSFDEENRSFSGYGIVFDSDSLPLVIQDRDLGGVKVYEQITRESMEGANVDDMISARDHNFSQILGRTSAGTLELSVDDKGVMYRIPSLPDTTYANDLQVSTSRGDIRGSSFTFSIDWEKGYDIQERSDGGLVAKPRQITKVYEIM